MQTYLNLIPHKSPVTYRGQEYRVFPDDSWLFTSPHHWKPHNQRVQDILLGLFTDTGRLFATAGDLGISDRPAGTRYRLFPYQAYLRRMSVPVPD